jgi:hypothetical protein
VKNDQKTADRKVRGNVIILVVMVQLCFIAVSLLSGALVNGNVQALGPGLGAGVYIMFRDQPLVGLAIVAILFALGAYGVRLASNAGADGDG